MKKVIRLTESDLIRLVKRVISEQFDSEIKSDTKPSIVGNPQNNVNSGYEELKSRLNSYKNKMTPSSIEGDFIICKMSPH